MPSSSAKCSAAKVGPNRSSAEPEYFFWIRFSTRPRNFSGLLRFEGRPDCRALAPCCPVADTAATVFSPGDSSAPASPLHRSASAPHYPHAPLPPHVPAHDCSSPSSPTGPPLAGGLSLRGHF